MKIKGLLIEPLNEPKVVEIDDSLESLQSVVDGYIEMVCPPTHPDEAVIIANEEGKILGLEANRPVRLEDGRIYDIICGNMFICNAPYDSENFASLTDQQIEMYKNMYFKTISIDKLLAEIIG